MAEDNPFYDAISQISSSLRKKVFGTSSKTKPKSVTRAQRAALASDGGFSKLLKKKKEDAKKRKERLAKQQKNVKGQGQSGGVNLTRVRTGAKSSTINLTKNEGKVIKSKDNLEDRKKALAKRMSKLPKKRPDSVKALSIIKKDVNIKGKGKSFKDYTSIAAAKRAGSLYYMGKDGKKKAAVTKADLDKSGLSLRDYINFKLGKTRKGK
jgi:chaperonin cofactor prefoldin